MGNHRLLDTACNSDVESKCLPVFDMENGDYRLEYNLLHDIVDDLSSLDADDKTDIYIDRLLCRNIDQSSNQRLFDILI